MELKISLLAYSDNECFVFYKNVGNVASTLKNNHQLHSKQIFLPFRNKCNFIFIFCITKMILVSRLWKREMGFVEIKTIRRHGRKLKFLSRKCANINFMEMAEGGGGGSPPPIRGPRQKTLQLREMQNHHSNAVKLRFAGTCGKFEIIAPKMIQRQTSFPSFQTHLATNYLKYFSKSQIFFSSSWNEIAVTCTLSSSRYREGQN